MEPHFKIKNLPKYGTSPIILEENRDSLQNGYKQQSSLKVTPRNNLNSPISSGGDSLDNDNLRNMDQRGFPEHAMNKKKSVKIIQKVNSSQSLQKKIELMEKGRIKQLEQKLIETQHCCIALSQLNSSLRQQLQIVKRKVIDMQIECENIIEQNKKELQLKESQNEQVKRIIKQIEKQSLKKEEDLVDTIQKLKKNANADYNSMILIKEKEIHSLQDKIKDLQNQNHEYHIYELKKQNKHHKQKLKEMESYIEERDTMMKKMSKIHDELVLENQLLKHSKMQANHQTNAHHQLLDLKSKYKLLQEMNKKLQLQLQSILREAEEMRKRQTILEMEVEELEQKLTNLKEQYEKDKLSMTHRSQNKSIGKIRMRKIDNLTPKSTLKAVETKILNKKKQIQENQAIIHSLEERQMKRDRIDELIIRQLKKNVEYILKILNLEDVQAKVYEILGLLDKIPMIKASYLRNSCENCDILSFENEFQEFTIMKKLQKFHNCYDKNEGQKKMKGRQKPILTINVDDSDDKVEQELFEQLKDTGNTQNQSYLFKNS